MTLDEDTISVIAERLETAELKRRPVRKITDDYPEMDWDDAYAVQYAIRRRKEERGNRTAGLKMGLTSRAKMQQMGVETPVYGFLPASGSYPENSEIDISAFIHPRVEAEVAVYTRAPLSGTGLSMDAVFDALDFIVPAVEIIDSRYENFRFDLKSVIADNTSAAGYVAGSINRDPRQLDLPTLGVVMRKNGTVVETGAGAAVLGHPVASIVMLAEMLEKRGEVIPAGTFIMTGGITAAVAVEQNDCITVSYQELGDVSMKFI